ncbi:hypothetical protein Tco_1302694 [Tanacetum coccineum]
MGDEHLSTIPKTESDELIKSSVENLVPISSEFEGISEITCDGARFDDDDFEDIEYVSLEEVNDVDQEEKDDSFFEESDTSLSHLDNSLPEFDTFSDHTKETRSGSTMTHANNSLPEYDSFLFEVEPDQGGLTSVVISDNSNDPLLEPPEFESFHFDPSFLVLLP